MGNIWAANKMLGTGIDDTLDRNTSVAAFTTNIQQKTAQEIFSLFPQCKHVANTFRFMDSPTHNLFYGTYHTPDGNYHS